MLRRISVWQLFIIALFLAYYYPILFLYEINDRDWNYFNALSLVVRSNWLSYLTLPIHDPWMSGGTNLLLNPQNRIFSLFAVFDLVFVPYWANLLSLVAYSFLGMIGMYLLLRSYEVSARTAVLGAILFVNGSWFGLHNAEGHITFGAFHLLPLIVLSLRRFEEPWSVPVYFFLMAHFLLDGAIYCFIFSVLLSLSLLLVGLIRLKTVTKALLDHRWVFVGSLCFFFLFSSPKWFPMVFERMPRGVALFHIEMSTYMTAISLLWPFQKIKFSTGTFVTFHEMGCYLGILNLGILGGALIRYSGFFKQNWRLFVFMLLWFWIASGWFPEWNPAQVLFEKIPFINSMRVQSRFLILMFLLYIVVLTRAIDRADWKRREVKVVLAFILFESVIVHNFPMSRYKNHQRVALSHELIKNEKMLSTDYYGMKPIHYYRARGSFTTYEPASMPTEVLVTGSKNYRGEIYLVDGNGSVELISYTPGEIVFESKGQGEKVVGFNTNDLGHWVPSEKGVTVISERGKTLEVRLEEGVEGRLSMHLRPSYIPWIVLSWVIGLFGFSFLILKGKFWDVPLKRLREQPFLEL